MSDWGATNDRVAGVRAGMDLEMPGSGGAFDKAVERAVTDGQLTPAQVATCADRVLDLVERSPRIQGAPANLGDHEALARRAAAQSSVLLTNDGILPLDRGASVALIGAFAEMGLPFRWFCYPFNHGNDATDTLVRQAGLEIVQTSCAAWHRVSTVTSWRTPALSREKLAMVARQAATVDRLVVEDHWWFYEGDADFDALASLLDQVAHEPFVTVEGLPLSA